MSTRSRIAAVYPDGSVRSIYCHSDGYLEGVGKMLLENYTDSAKVEELMDLGDLSFLGTTTQHNPDDWTNRYYGDERCRTYKDRGEDDVDGKWYKSFDHYVHYLREGWNEEEFFYLFKDGKWHLQETSGGKYNPVPLIIDSEGKIVREVEGELS